MKARLTKALANAKEGEALDLKKQLGIGRSNIIANLQTAAKTGLEAKAQLEDPALPGKSDLARWYPEPPQPRPARLLISPRTPQSARATGPPSCQVARTSALTAGAATSRPHTTSGAQPTRQSADAPSAVPGVSIAFASLAQRQKTGEQSDQEGEPATTPAAMRAVLAKWVSMYDEDAESFASRAVFIEMRLRQALACSAKIGVPNQFRCAIICDAWERVVPFAGRLEAMLRLLWAELLRCVYVDFAPKMIGGGAKAYADRTPFFVEVHRLQRAAESAAEKMRAWELQREQELALLEERNKAINHTLGAWNRALGFSSGVKHKDAIAEQLSSLAGNLTEANKEAAELSRRASTAPLPRCIEAFHALGLVEKTAFLNKTGLTSEAAAECMNGRSQDQNIQTMAHLLSKLPAAHVSDVLKAGLRTLSSEIRLLVAESLLLEATDEYSAAGSCIGSVLGTVDPADLRAMIEGMSVQLGPDGRVVETILNTLGAARARSGRRLSSPRRPSSPRAMEARSGTSSLIPSPTPDGASVTESMAQVQRTSANASNGLERWKRREEELLQALESGQDREMRLDAKAARLQKELRESGPALSRRIAQIEAEKAATKKELTARLADVSEALSVSQAETARYKREQEAMKSALDSATSSKRQLDVKVANEIHALDGERKLHQADNEEALRRINALERELMDEKNARAAAESAKAVIAEKSASAVAEQKQKLAAALKLLEGESRSISASLQGQADNSANTAAQLKTTHASSEFKKASEEAMKAVKEVSAMASAAERKFDAEKRSLEGRLELADKAMNEARAQLQQKNDAVQVSMAAERQRFREEVDRLELEVAKVKAEAEAGVEARLRMALDEERRRLRYEYEDKIQAERAWFADTTSKRELEFETERAASIKAACTEMQDEFEKRLDMQRETVQAQAQTALLQAQLHSSKPLGASTGLPHRAPPDRRPSIMERRAASDRGLVQA